MVHQLLRVGIRMQAFIIDISLDQGFDNQRLSLEYRVCCITLVALLGKASFVH